MELSIIERLKLLEVLPAQGDIGTLKIARKLRETLGFTEEEIEATGIKVEASDAGIKYVWETSKEKPLSIEFKPMSIRIITDALRKANQKGTLTEQHISLYEKFMGEVKEEE